MLWAVFQKAELPPPPPPPPFEVTLLPVPDFDIEDVSPITMGKPCSQGEKTYVGVGIEYNLTGLATKVPEHLPAYGAGVRVGDLFLGPYEGYELGKPIDVWVRRNHRLMVFRHLMPTTICYRS